MRSTRKNLNFSTTTIYQSSHQYFRTPNLKELSLEEKELIEYDCQTNLIDLNDDCLFAIFAKLSFKEKVDLIRVSKRWQRVLKEVIDNDVRCLTFSGKETQPAQLNISLIELFARNSPFIDKFGFFGVQKVSIFACSSFGTDSLRMVISSVSAIN